MMSRLAQMLGGVARGSILDAKGTRTVSCAQTPPFFQCKTLAERMARAFIACSERLTTRYINSLMHAFMRMVLALRLRGFCGGAPCAFAHLAQ